MFIEECKYAIRYLGRNKPFAVIHTAGLAISLTAFLLLFLYIRDEWSFDRFHDRAGDIYRVVDSKETTGNAIPSAQTAAPVAPAMAAEFPLVEAVTRIIPAQSLVKADNRLFNERKFYYADASLFDVFTFPLQAGKAGAALSAPHSIVLTAKTAKKYFGKTAVLGKTLLLDGVTYTITGVAADVPANSHWQWDALLSMSTAIQAGSGYDWLFSNWYSNQFHTYIKLKPDAAIAGLQGQMTAFDQRHREAAGNTRHHYGFEPLTSIYLHSLLPDQLGVTGSASRLYLFSVIAFFLVVIACVNGVNLSTARYTERAKEVGVKKVSGAGRWQLVRQFMVESVLLSLVSIALAGAVVYFLLPAFNTFTGKQLQMDFGQPAVWLTMLGLVFFAGILAGIYPALLMSRLSPAASLKGKLFARASTGFARKGLVVFQFTVSIVLAICTLVVYRQMNYLVHQDPGFSTEQVMVINFDGDQAVKRRLPAIKSAVSALPFVSAVSASSHVPGDGKQGGWSINLVKPNGDSLETELDVYPIDFDFQRQYSLQPVAGRLLSTEFTGDSTESMLINEAAVRKLGFAKAEESLGTVVDMYPKRGRIVGVVKDFHYEGFQKAVAPLAMRVLPEHFNMLSVTLNGKDIRNNINSIAKTWLQRVPERLFEFVFLDDTFNRQYQSEVWFGQVFAIFAAIACVVASLGLFGLALFSVRQRTKEIGIRKVLGASVASLAGNIGLHFLRLVMIAFLVAAPLAYFFMDHWLAQFAYRQNVGLLPFVLAGVTALLLAVLTISYHTISAAMANPVKSIKSD